MIKSRTNTSGIAEQNWMIGRVVKRYIAFDPDDPQQFYGGCYQGYIDVLDTKQTKQKTSRSIRIFHLPLNREK
jgi:hypothetical protein